MDEDKIQQTNLVSDDTAAAMNDSAQPEIIQPQKDSTPAPEPPVKPMPTATPTENINPTPDLSPDPASSTPSAPSDKPTLDPVASQPAADLSELDAIKKSALDELQPLIEHVEQSPEERYETVMMMIRSNDDPSLVSQAYEAAKGIENEKARANALLNIVSEIEYLKSKTNS